MTTQTWIQVVGGLALGSIALLSFLKLRAMRSQLTRESLFTFIAQFVLWTVFGLFFFQGVLFIFYFATVAAIYVPTIIWILRLPKDDPAP